LIHVQNLDDTFVPVYAELGFLYNTAGKYELAINNFNRALTADLFYDFQLYEERAKAYEALHEYQAAVDDYSKLIEDYSKEGSVFRLDKILEKRGKCYQDLDEAAKAKADFDKAAELREKERH
jgi:tetratricopeptide (TPR) repeat protein